MRIASVDIRSAPADSVPAHSLQPSFPIRKELTDMEDEGQEQIFRAQTESSIGYEPGRHPCRPGCLPRLGASIRSGPYHLENDFWECPRSDTGFNQTFSIAARQWCDQRRPAAAHAGSAGASCGTLCWPSLQNPNSPSSPFFILFCFKSGYRSRPRRIHHDRPLLSPHLIAISRLRIILTVKLRRDSTFLSQ